MSIQRQFSFFFQLYWLEWTFIRHFSRIVVCIRPSVVVYWGERLLKDHCRGDILTVTSLQSQLHPTFPPGISHLKAAWTGREVFSVCPPSVCHTLLVIWDPQWAFKPSALRPDHLNARPTLLKGWLKAPLSLSVSFFFPPLPPSSSVPRYLFLCPSILHFTLLVLSCLTLPSLSVSSAALTPFMSPSSPEVELPIMIKWTMTAWASAEEWTLLRGFILLSAEIQRESSGMTNDQWPGQDDSSWSPDWETDMEISEIYSMLLSKQHTIICTDMANASSREEILHFL